LYNKSTTTVVVQQTQDKFTTNRSYAVWA